MKQFGNTKIVWPIFAILLSVAKASTTIGSKCTISSNNKVGTCKLFKNCPEASEKASRGIHPTICGYQRLLPIICCDDNTPTNVPDKVTTDNRNTFVYPSDINNKNLRKADRKCLELRNLYTTSVDFLSLSASSKPESIKTAKCSKDGTPLVVGGRPASPGEFPYTVAMRYSDGDYKCGGTLISENFVLTAAHCILTLFGEPVSVTMGTLSLTGSDGYSSPVHMDIERNIRHPDHVASKKYNDIALSKLKGRVEFTEYLRPACLWTKNTLNHPKAIATGWGEVRFAGDNSHHELRAVTLDLLSNTLCQRTFPPDSKFPNGIIGSMLCSGVLAGKEDTCRGDSGGPLVVTDKQNQCVFYVVGITSFGKYCGLQNTPAIYTRVSEFVPWIERTVWPDN